MMKLFAPSPEHISDRSLGEKLKIEPIYHRRFRYAMFKLAELHHHRRAHDVGGGMLLIGPSGAGKSTLAKEYERKYPRSFEKQRTHIPVQYVKVPSSPTVKSLAGAILEAIGDHRSHRGTAPEKTTRLLEFIKRCDIEILLLDEFQHFFYSPSVTAFRDITDWLKSFLDSSRLGIVGFGLSTAELIIRSNEQLSRRFSPSIPMDPFSLEDEADFNEYRGLLKAIESCLPIESEIPLYEANLARRIHTASFGLLDYTIKLLDGAVSEANKAGLHTLSLDVLAAGFREHVWNNGPDILNPFHPESPIRPLTRPGEAFYMHTCSDSVGSPVAVKLGLRGNKGGARHA
ncbi:TniB family NTP-binding protein (plasmid) [Chromobacterium amazonense]|uniref:TniB family NTP-binding protein n=1 Tax=Chromobacterium amazonense TaxID=1382803 RepID=UPI00237EB92D|nr:TniB family NTP-binding protein [Chromobacterium amazonense]MDE1713576.1 TniB family NTP-binding protein [Chromobacterium amazonense]